MRKMLLTPLMLCFVALLSALSMPAVSAQPNEPLRCDVSFQLNWDWVGFGGSSPYTWIGTISGDIEGTVTLSLISASFPGITEHYSETWIITTTYGSITMYQEGVWSFKSFEFKSNGWITAATGAWAYLLESDAHVRGVTTPFPVPPPTPVTAAGIMWIGGFGPE
ncbi:MAG TPA: hypothetical protein VJ249_07405 [Candidatus Bathyarchaeia archaeon]|nr:hypothetical protein [Candidatus Bathyarchaeia archaeon]